MRALIFLLLIWFATLEPTKQPAALAARIALVSPPSDSLLQAVLFAAQNVYSLGIINNTVIPSLNIDPVWLNGSAYENLQVAQAAAAVPDTVLAIISTDDASIGGVFDSRDVRPICFPRAHWSPNGTAGAQTILARSLIFPMNIFSFFE